MSLPNRPNPGRMGIRRSARVAILGGLLALSSLAAAAPYTLGQGYPLPFLGLTAGGYLSVQVNAPEGSDTQASIQDLSLFLHSDPSPDWHFFTEIELSTPVTITHDGVSSKDIDLDFERFYVDHNLAARSTLRLGKFLTPVGHWNQIHADPLVWTVSRPLTTSAAFAKNASGVQLYGSWPLGRAAVDYQVYVDDTANLDPSEGHEKTFMDLNIRPNPPSSFRHGVGARVQYRSFDDNLLIGLSAGRFVLRDLAGFKDLVGADILYSRNDYEFSGEAIFRRDDDGTGKNEWGGFAQAVIPLGHAFYGIARHERYKAELFDRAVDSTSLGVTYRPTPPLSIKLERRESSGEERLAPDGWLFSVAVLF